MYIFSCQLTFGFNTKLLAVLMCADQTTKHKQASKTVCFAVKQGEQRSQTTDYSNMIAWLALDLDNEGKLCGLPDRTPSCCKARSVITIVKPWCCN